MWGGCDRKDVCVCVKERERDRERERGPKINRKIDSKTNYTKVVLGPGLVKCSTS